MWYQWSDVIWCIWLTTDDAVDNDVNNDREEGASEAENKKDNELPDDSPKTTGNRGKKKAASAKRLKKGPKSAAKEVET